jgi:hypothetical protein
VIPEVKIRMFGILAGVALVLSACGDDPFVVRWEELPLEAVLYSLDRDAADIPRASAFHMLERRGVIVEDPQAQGRWDFAVERQGDGMVLLPPRALGVISRAGIAAIPQVRFEDVIEAPRDTLAYSMEAPVPVQMGTIYVIRTHQQPGFFGQICHFYGKVEPLEIDLEAGTLRILHDVSPDCNNRSLVPPR